MLYVLSILFFIFQLNAAIVPVSNSSTPKILGLGQTCGGLLNTVPCAPVLYCFVQFTYPEVADAPGVCIRKSSVTISNLNGPCGGGPSFAQVCAPGLVCKPTADYATTQQGICLSN